MAITSTLFFVLDDLKNSEEINSFDEIDLLEKSLHQVLKELEIDPGQQLVNKVLQSI